MKRLLFVLMGVFMMLASHAASYRSHYDDINTFTEDEYDIAIQKSKLENKLVLLDFHAKWCTPCKWMEKTTFKDERVLEVLNNKYVTIKVDIDDFDGFDLKEKYAVQTLPTLIFLNKETKVIGRIDETIGIEKFLDIIKTQSAEVIPIVHATNVAPGTKKDSNLNQSFSDEEPYYRSSSVKKLNQVIIL